MAIPSITQTIRDPGLPTTPAAITNFLYIGCAEKGSTTAVLGFNNPADVIDTYGQGPLSEDLCYHLAVAGGPVYAVRSAGSVAAANSSVTKTAAGSSTGTVTISGTARDSYEGRVEIKVTGTSGTAQFVYSMDAGRTYSPQLLVPSGNTYAVPDTGITLTFVPGAGATYFEKGDYHTFTTTEATFNATDLAAAITVVRADNTPIAAVVLSGQFATASAAALIAAAASTHAATLFQLYRPVRFIMDAGADVAATTKTAFASFSSERVSLCYGRNVCFSGKSITGRSAPTCSIVRSIAARAAESLPSTDLAWYSAGALRGVSAITHDEFRTETMDADGFTTLRTHQGIPGFFPTNVRLKSNPGSDYQFWQHGRVMDIASYVSYWSLLPFLSSSVRTTATGAIDPRDADIWKAAVEDALRAALQDPDNAQGYPGYVSALQCDIDKISNVLTTGIVKVKVAVRPLGYAKFIVNTLSFAANVGS